MLKRFWRYFVALFSDWPDAGDPSTKAQRQEAQQYAVAQMLADMRKRLDELSIQADAAEAQGNRTLVRKLLKKRDALAATLARTEQSLAQSERIAERVNQRIRDLENEIRWSRLQEQRGGPHSRGGLNPTLLDQALRWALGTLLALIVLLALALALNYRGGF